MASLGLTTCFIPRHTVWLFLQKVKENAKGRYPSYMDLEESSMPKYVLFKPGAKPKAVIFRPYFTAKSGVRYWARTYGYKAWPIPIY